MEKNNNSDKVVFFIYFEERKAEILSSMLLAIKYLQRLLFHTKLNRHGNKLINFVMLPTEKLLLSKPLYCICSLQFIYNFMKKFCQKTSAEPLHILDANKKMQINMLLSFSIDEGRLMKLRTIHIIFLFSILKSEYFILQGRLAF